MRIGQPDIDRADAEDGDHHGLFRDGIAPNPLKWEVRLERSECFILCANCDTGASHSERNVFRTARDIAKKILRCTLRVYHWHCSEIL
jgi:hypothetical protein